MFRFNDKRKKLSSLLRLPKIHTCKYVQYPAICQLVKYVVIFQYLKKLYRELVFCGEKEDKREVVCFTSSLHFDLLQHATTYILTITFPTHQKKSPVHISTYNIFCTHILQLSAYRQGNKDKVYELCEMNQNEN